MNRRVCMKSLSIAIAALPLLFGGCVQTALVTGAGSMVKVGSVNVEEEAHYSDESAADELIANFASQDGLCEIKQYASYYDVTLDYEKGSPEEVGAAYAATLKEAAPHYEAVIEPYLYENIRHSFGGRNVNYDALTERIMTLEAAIPDEYRKEIESFARVMANGEEGYSANGELSYIELLTAQIIPDALRPTACSALSFSGSMTASGPRITMRNLEWSLGSDAQIAAIHAVTHMKKAERSITVIGMLGIFDIITAVNDDGVMIGILDVGSDTSAMEGMPYVYEGKKCYTFEIRAALERFDNARDAGEYLLSESGDFTWCNNMRVSDKKDVFCCENATREVQEAGRAVSVLRSPDTELMEGLLWDRKDAFCIVNSFATKGNNDSFTGMQGNIDRFAKYNLWVNEKEKFSAADVKALMAKEHVKEYGVVNVHNSGTVHTVILDYSTGNIQAAFTHDYYADDVPEYVTIGHF